jgi:predicted  nucleic acid-binding Zn-ribbon protein
MGTLARLIREIREEARALTESPEGRKLFLEVWGLAVKEGRAQQEAVIAELQESVEALAAENERLEGAFLAERNLADDLEKEKSRLAKELSHAQSRAEEELRQARTAQAKASEKAEGALQQLSDARGHHAKQLEDLQADLKTAVAKAYDFQLRLVRAEALLEARDVPPPLTESRNPGEK